MLQNCCTFQCSFGEHSRQKLWWLLEKLIFSNNVVEAFFFFFLCIFFCAFFLRLATFVAALLFIRLCSLGPSIMKRRRAANSAQMLRDSQKCRIRLCSLDVCLQSLDAKIPLCKKEQDQRRHSSIKEAADVSASD